MQAQQRITQIDESRYIIHYCDRIAVKYEKLKRNDQVRIRAIYLSFLSFNQVRGCVVKVQPVFKCQLDVRTPKHTIGQHEIRLSGIKLADQTKAEQFISELLTAIAERDRAAAATAEVENRRRLAARTVTKPPAQFQNRVTYRQGATVFAGVGID